MQTADLFERCTGHRYVNKVLSSQEDVVSRSPSASLSPAEMNALRRLGSELASSVPTEMRGLLLSMGLVRVNKAGRVKLTEEGKRRLRATGVAGLRRSSL